MSVGASMFSPTASRPKTKPDAISYTSISLSLAGKIVVGVITCFGDGS